VNHSLAFVFASLLALSTAAIGADGLIAIKSPFSLGEAAACVASDGAARHLVAP